MGNLPPVPYDTSLKIFRPVYKECQLSYNGNRYLIPHELVGKKVMLKIKGNIIRIYHDHDLVVTYEEPEEKHRLVGDPAIYQRLAADREQSLDLVREMFAGRSDERAYHRQSLPRGGDPVPRRV